MLQGYEEVMAYGIPGYRKDNVPEVSFNSQKNYISLYILKKDVLGQYREDLKDVNVGKGCIRYTKPEKIDFDLIEKC